MIQFFIGCVVGFVAGVLCFDYFIKAIGYREAVKEMELDRMRKEKDRNEY